MIHSLALETAELTTVEDEPLNRKLLHILHLRLSMQRKSAYKMKRVLLSVIDSC